MGLMFKSSSVFYTDNTILDENSSLSPMAHWHAVSDHPSIGSHSQELVPTMISFWLLITMTLMTEAISF